MVLGTRSFIDGQPDLQVCGCALSPDEVERKLPAPLPDLIVFELCISGPFDFEVLKAFRRRHPDVPVLAYSYHEEVIFARRALQAGANGYLMKEAEPGQLAVAIREMLSGGTYLTERVRRRFAYEDRPSCELNGSLVNSFTNRELQIFQALGDGLSDDAICTQTGLSRSSVSSAQSRMRKKMSLQTRDELVHCAMHWAYYEGDFA